MIGHIDKNHDKAASQVGFTDEELGEFLRTVEAPPRSPGLQSVAARLSRDLVGSKRRFAAYYVLVIAFGYFLSLSVCGQHNLGFFVLSRLVADWIATLHWSLCAVTCGALFTGIPFLASSVFLSRFQQRYLLFRLWTLVFGLPIFATGLLLVARTHFAGGHQAGMAAGAVAGQMNSPAWFALWISSAILTPFVLEGLIFLLFIKRSLSNSA